MATAPLTRPLPLGFSASPEGGERASGGLGDCRAWGWGSRRSDPAGFPFIFQRRKWERHSGRQQMPRHPRATGRNESSLLATLKRATPRAPPGRAPREPPPIKGSETRGFRVGDGRPFPRSPPSNARATQARRGQPSLVFLPRRPGPSQTSCYGAMAGGELPNPEGMQTGATGPGVELVQSASELPCLRRFSGYS